jgi:hypothetical protein
MACYRDRFTFYLQSNRSGFRLVVQIKVSDLNEVRVLSSAFFFFVERTAFELHIKWELYWNNTNQNQFY